VRYCTTAFAPTRAIVFVLLLFLVLIVVIVAASFGHDAVSSKKERGPERLSPKRSRLSTKFWAQGEAPPKLLEQNPTAATMNTRRARTV
jgi:hypothetical protein